MKALHKESLHATFFFDEIFANKIEVVDIYASCT